MKLSWSHKLFFKINSQIGKRKWLDFVMLISAHYLIYFLCLLAVAWGDAFLGGDLFKIYIKLLLTVLVFSILTSWFIGWLWPHRRPIVEFPDIKQLFRPVETWKSFPSDHTTISFVFVFLTFLMGASIWFSVFLFFIGLLIGSARVYAGVHYPRDILGGIGLALFYCLISYWLVVYITQPIYSFFVGII